MPDLMPPAYDEPALHAMRAITSPMFLTGEDDLRLTVLNAAAGVTVRFSGRFLPVAGRVMPFVHELTPATDRTASTLIRQLGEGWLLSASVHASAGSPNYGRTYAVLQVTRGDGAAAIGLDTLAQGYITGTQRIAWPGGPIASALDGLGALRSIVGTDPAAGVEISETVPTGARWRLLGMSFQLVTSAVVANRSVSLAIDDGANVILQISDNQVQAASLTHSYQALASGQIAMMGGSTHTLNLPPDVWLAAGFRVRTVTGSKDAGDNYTAPVYLVAEYIEGA